MSLKSYKALLFDCYGTLIDWESGMLENLTPLLEQQGAPSRQRLFEVLGPNETRIQTETPTMLYSDVLTEVYHAVAKELKLEDSNDKAKAYGNSVGSWPAFVDSADALNKLSKLGLKLIILSNVNGASFEGSKQQLEKGYTFDGIYTAEKIGSYKPSLRNFEYAIAHAKEDFGVEKDEILIVANSKLHDVQPGHKMGLKAAWINRPKAVMGVTAYTDVIPDWEFPDMASFAAAMAEAKSS